MKTLGDLVTDVSTRLGDPGQAVWTADEITIHLVNAYQQLANELPVFYDWTYLEDLPPTFSYTQPWEQPYLARVGGFDAGCANFTSEFERRAIDTERTRYGPAAANSPFEVTEGFLSDAGGPNDIPATAELPKSLTALARVTWDKRGLDAMEARRLSRVDSRYEITKGEVYGYIWQKDGVRTLRKVRVPAAACDTITANGAWGALRNPADLSGDTVTGTWGVPRRIPGHHPIGPGRFGTPRRPYLEGKNVRVEHFRHGRALVEVDDVCELPDRYALYLRDYAQSQCLQRNGPGQDLELAKHFHDRWARGLARVERRTQVVDAEKTIIMGGDGRPSVTRPPHPSRPWPYGSVVR